MLKFSQLQIVTLGGVQRCPHRHWVEIELLDETDHPIANEEYIIREPDGLKVRSGTLDGDGFAREEGLLAKPYEVSFPRLDKDLWQSV